MTAPNNTAPKETIPDNGPKCSKDGPKVTATVGSMGSHHMGHSTALWGPRGALWGPRLALWGSQGGFLYLGLKLFGVSSL